MNTYMDEISTAAARREETGFGLPGWLSFAAGGILTFVFVFMGVARPAGQELAKMRRRLSTLEQSVWEVAGQKDTARASNELLALLVEQKQHTKEASEAMLAIQQLHQQFVNQTADMQQQFASQTAEMQQQLAAQSTDMQQHVDLMRQQVAVQSERLYAQLSAQSQQLQEAMDFAAQLIALKDVLANNRERVTEASDVLADSEEVLETLASSVETSFEAKRAGDQLLSLEESLLQRRGETEIARENLDQLFDLRDSLGADEANVQVAQGRVEDLVGLKNSIISKTDDLAEAIETLELTTDLTQQYHEAALAFENIRQWMVEIVAMEPMLARARRSLEPLTELGNLRRLDRDQIKAVAQNLSQTWRTQVANKPIADHVVPAEDVTTPSLDPSSDASQGGEATPFDGAFRVE
ncbi:MAG: hypothetical protein KDA60_13310 [Planctomycetales bacterium]|nr:hypothetical protein [Planctomycetales bacterium]